MTTPTPLPLDAAARNLLHYINVMPDADTLLTPEVLFAETQLRAALSQPDTFAARVAELERERDAFRAGEGMAERVALDLRDEADKWRITANALRDALEGLLPALERNAMPHSAHVVRNILAQTPAQSLAAYRKSVLEEARKAFLLARPCSCRELSNECSMCRYWMRGDDAIYALAAQAQEAPNA